MTEEFVRLLIAEVRDPAIRTLAAMASGSIKGEAGTRWAVACADIDQSVRTMLVADAVDEVMFRFLERIDAGAFGVMFEQELVDPVDTQMSIHADYITDDGLRDRFATEARFPA